MKCQIILPACFLLLWTAFVRCQEKSDIVVKTISDGIELTCPENQIFKPKGDRKLILKYQDTNTGEYTCVNDNNIQETEGSKIYVKFRTCDNCIELDEKTIAGLAIGDVVATIVIGVAVYLFASQARIDPVTSNKKSSDRQHLVPNEVSSSSSRAPNDHYQPLKRKGGDKDMYDVLTNRR